jgi:hypothetical protein
VRLRTFTTLAIVFTMAAKLPFARCMLALLAGLLVGLFISIPVFLRKS